MEGSNETVLADLSDAMSRGRLTLAELAVIRPSELNALFELACERLDTERNQDARSLLGCLVALFPYDHRYWRAYGIALHRQLELDAARAAYDTALRLEPEDDATRCYRGEVALYEGDRAGALRDLTWVVNQGRPALRDRAEALLQHVGPRTTVGVERGARPVAPAKRGDFTLTDNTPLPLDDGRFSAPEPLSEETTVTDVVRQWLDGTSPGDANPGLLEKSATGKPVSTAHRIPAIASASNLPRARLARGQELNDNEVVTGRVRRRRDELEALPESPYAGDTAKVRRTSVRAPGDGDTARIPRKRKPTDERGDTDLVTRVRIERERFEATEPRASENTALTRRRLGLPLGREE